jgi:multidrug resistance efflux pump
VTLTHFEPGVVRSVHVRLYDPVVSNQILVSMDDREEQILLDAITQDIKRMQADVAAAEARLVAENARAITEYVDLSRRFAIDREAAHIEYLTVRLADARNRAELRGASVEHELVLRLYETGDAPLRELNQARTVMESLQEAIEENQPVLARTKTAFEDTDRRWRDYVDQYGVTTKHDPVLDPLRLAVEVRSRDLTEVVRRIDAHVLRAPISGQVTSLPVRPGDHLVAGTLLAQISPDATHQIVAYLPERLALATDVGAPVRVRCLADVAGGRREYLGTVVRVSASVTEAPPRFRSIPTYPVWGRGIIIALAENIRLVPGEATAISFLRD